VGLSPFTFFFIKYRLDVFYPLSSCGFDPFNQSLYYTYVKGLYVLPPSQKKPNPRFEPGHMWIGFFLDGGSIHINFIFICLYVYLYTYMYKIIHIKPVNLG
jgi:hypothetical protein